MLAEADFAKEGILEQSVIGDGIATAGVITAQQEFSEVSTQVDGLLVIIDELNHLVMQPFCGHTMIVSDVIILFPHSKVHSEIEVGIAGLVITRTIVRLDLFSVSATPAPRGTAKPAFNRSGHDRPQAVGVFRGDRLLIESQVMLSVGDDDVIGVGFGRGFHRRNLVLMFEGGGCQITGRGCCPVARQTPPHA